MNNIIDKTTEFTQIAAPEIPFDPPIPPLQSSIPVPMVYVEKSDQVEYRVKILESLTAENLETELNKFGRDGWWLTQIIHQKKNALLVFSRRSAD
jgi:hypothetical protein